MVMAAGTRKRHAQKGAGGDIDLLVDDIHLQLFFVCFGESFGAEHEKARGQMPSQDLAGLGRGIESISGDLLEDELVVRHVPVECFDDVVSITPGIPHHEISIVGSGICIPYDIQPMPSPALTVMP